MKTQLLQNCYKNFLKTILGIISVIVFSAVNAQTWTHDFETVGGYSTSMPECNDGSGDYFTRTDVGGIAPSPVGAQGSFFFGAQDMDGAPCTNFNASFTFDDINITGCTGLNLTFAAATTFNQMDSPDFIHVMYDIDNSGTWTNLIWFEGDETTGTNDPIAIDTDFNGVGDGGGVTGTFSDFNTAITGTGALIDIRFEFYIDHGSEDFYIDNIRLFGSCGAPATTINTGAVTGSPFSVDCSVPSTDNGTVAFTSTGTFNAGNTFTAQMSDASGSFASPTTVGTLSLSGVDPSDVINITIPATASAGSGYLIRIVADNPSTSGSNSATFQINQTGSCGPQLPSSEGLIINEWSNGASGNTEYYEFVVAGQCGTSVDIRGYILDDNNGTFSNLADFVAENATGIAPGHFRFADDPQWASIPVGSLIVVYNDAEPNPSLPPSDPYDSDNDSLYVVPHINALFESCTLAPDGTPADSTYTACLSAAPGSYSVGGAWNPLSLRNTGDAIQVRMPDGTYYHGVSYGNSEMTGGPHNLKLFTGSGSAMCGWFTDGDFFDVANWSSGNVAGNETPGLPNNAANEAWLRLMRDPLGTNCPIQVLPVSIAGFEGESTQYGNLLNWNTVTERNSQTFTVERSNGDGNWTIVGIVPAAGNSETVQSYQLLDDSAGEEINYYRLIETDTDGSIYKYYRIVTIDNSAVEVKELIGIYNILGQPVTEDFQGIQLRLYSDGSTERVYNQ